MPADGDAPPRFTHQQILRVLSGILLCIFLAAIDQTVVIPAVPAIAADLNGFQHLAWIVSAYLLTSTATTPIYGERRLWRFQPFWLRVVLEERVQEANRLLLASHGRSLAIGDFLAPAMRRELATTLHAALARWRAALNPGLDQPEA